MSNKVLSPVTQTKKREPKQRKNKKLRVWAFPTILGLAIGLIGLIALRPQISVNPQAPLLQSQAFSVPFRVENSSYYSISVVRTVLYIRHLTQGGVSFNGVTRHDEAWDNFVLDSGEGRDIVAPFSTGIPDDADIALVIDYKACRVCPSARKYFRFSGASGDNWQWLKQPSTEIREDADKRIADHLERASRRIH